MNSTAAIAASITLLFGMAVGIGATTQMSDGAAEIARGPARVAFLVKPTASAASVMLAQLSGTEPGVRSPPVLPPSVTTVPATAPSPSQQLQIQTYRNQLQLLQQPDAALTPQGFRNQLDAGEQLNQLDQLNRPSR